MEISDKIFISIALSLSITGLVILILILHNYNPDYISFSMAEKTCNDVVRMNATIASISRRKNMTFILLEDKTLVKGVVFDSLDNLKKGDFIYVEGDVNTYKGEDEIVVRRIKEVK